MGSYTKVSTWVHIDSLVFQIFSNNMSSSSEYSLKLLYKLLWKRNQLIFWWIWLKCLFFSSLSSSFILSIMTSKCNFLITFIFFWMSKPTNLVHFGHLWVYKPWFVSGFMNLSKFCWMILQGIYIFFLKFISPF